MAWCRARPGLIRLTAAILLTLDTGTYAHLSLWYPAPLGGAKEANAFSAQPDPLLNFPLGCCDEHGAPTLPDPGPCRGHLDRFEREEPQVVWTAGQDAYFQLSDFAYSPDAPGSTHGGGSCQVGFSVDGGITWKAAATFFGNCPHRGTGGSPDAQTFNFKIPQGIPSGEALFVWVWLNREHEAYVNCAKVRIGAGEDGAASASRSSGASRSAVSLPRSTGALKPPPQSSTEAYFADGARCMAGAKLSNPTSDEFEYGWDVPCGMIAGDGAYPIRTVGCGSPMKPGRQSVI
ncbi:hypothetical protein HBI23_255590 [Parastagonospora nodorum]|nr:hypothetical protein HBI23_255590 [Parastagonospora nodorum]